MWRANQCGVCRWKQDCDEERDAHVDGCVVVADAIVDAHLDVLATAPAFKRKRERRRQIAAQVHTAQTWHA